MAAGLCRKCGVLLDQWLRAQNLEYHPACAPDAVFSDPEHRHDQASSVFAAALREDLQEIIAWADRGSERSQQQAIGVSEVVATCWRRIGYQIAGIPERGIPSDPWPAIVGTAIHMWLQQAVDKYEDMHAIGRWFTEMTVHPSADVMGHTDLYDRHTFTVVDYKSKGADEMKEIRLGNIPHDAIDQIQLYGLGHERAGRKVEKVALVFVPRAGWLSGMYVWSGDYDRQRAEEILEKHRRIAAGISYYKVAEKPENWEKFPAVTGRGCSHCPWHVPSLGSATDQGCPGK